MLRKLLLPGIALVLLSLPLISSAAGSCVTLTRTLSLGSRGTDVTALQQFLVSQNLLNPSYATGYYGSLTQSAVRQFQCNQHIICSGSSFITGWGSVGPKTRAAIAAVSCIVTPPPPMSCTWNGQTIPSGQSVTAYQSSSVPTGQVCVSETRTCTNGVLSGSYQYASCSVATAQSCTFNGQTIASGSSVAAYQTQSVAFGQSCQSQRRTCTNGSLSGSFVNSSCSVQSPHLSNLKVGIIFDLWQCLFPQSNGDAFNMTKVVNSAGNGTPQWGSASAFQMYWSDEPADGYYCPSNNDALLRKQAQELRDAGVDFVIIDATNNPYVSDSDMQKMINQWFYPWTKPEEGIEIPFQHLLAVWSTVAGAPKVVPWVPIKNYPPAGTLGPSGQTCPNPDMVVFFDQYLHPGVGLYANMAFIYDGKPLLLADYAYTPADYGNCLDPDHSVAHNRFSDDEMIAAYSVPYTVRKMWGLSQFNSLSSDVWSFMEPCQSGFSASGGTIPCNQRVAIGPNGSPEQISVSSAYQAPGVYMSNEMTATSKLGGNTLTEQMATAVQYPSAPIMTINDWNE